MGWLTHHQNYQRMESIPVFAYWLLAILCLVVFAGATFYLLVPLLFFLLPGVMQHVFFYHKRDPSINYSDLAQHGIRSIGRNFYIKNEKQQSSSAPNTSHSSRLGVWHILPATVSQKYRKESPPPGVNNQALLERSLNEGSQAVVLHFHGSSCNRSNKLQCELYNKLSELDFHVLALDYHGYGDSDGSIGSGRTMIESARTLYHYARAAAPSKPIYMWGHSLGTGVAVKVAAELTESEYPVGALILEAPYNIYSESILDHPYFLPWCRFPLFGVALAPTLQRTGVPQSLERDITRVKCPVLALSSAGDPIMPVGQCRRLVARARQALGDSRVTHVEFPRERGLNHVNICRAEELPRLVEEFLLAAQLPVRSLNRVKRGDGEERSESEGGDNGSGEKRGKEGGGGWKKTLKAKVKEAFSSMK